MRRRHPKKEEELTIFCNFISSTMIVDFPFFYARFALFFRVQKTFIQSAIDSTYNKFLVFTFVTGLHFHVVGEGVVTARTSRQERTYDKENYIDFRMRLLGDADSVSQPTVLSPGIHSFPFKLGLPLGLPSTFLGRHGWIQYYCKCALREPSGLIHKNHQIFIIMNPIDLNIEEPSLAEPFRCEIEPTLGGLACISSGTVKCKIELDRGGKYLN